MEDKVQAVIHPVGEITNVISYKFDHLDEDAMKSLTSDDLDILLGEAFSDEWSEVHTFTPERLISKYNYNIHFDTAHGMMHMYQDKNDRIGTHVFMNVRVIPSIQTVEVIYDCNIVYQKYECVSILKNGLELAGLTPRIFFIVDTEHAIYFKNMFNEPAYEIYFNPDSKNIEDVDNIEDIMNDIIDNRRMEDLL